MMRLIQKIALLVVDDTQRLLLVRKENSVYFILPGGRAEGDETDLQALSREIKEELNCVLSGEGAIYLDTFRDRAANEPDAQVEVRLFKADMSDLSGQPFPCSEIEEIKWASYEDCLQLTIAPSIKNQILPYLRHNGYI